MALNRRKRPLASTPGGLGFLKCAFAAPDFNFDMSGGVPDTFTGRTLVKRTHFTIGTSNSTTQDVYIVVMPTPGVAAWIGANNVGAVVPGATGVQLAPLGNTTDFQNMFPGFAAGVSGEADNFTSFRYVSTGIELVSTSNSMTWAGSISCWKAPITSGDFLVGQWSKRPNIEGTASINLGNNQDVFVGASNQGVYSVAASRTDKWEFTPITVDGQQSMARSATNPDTSQFFYLNSQFVGLGDLESIIIKIPPTAVLNNFVIRTWACIEYQPNTSSNLYEYSRASPLHDPLALETYARMVMTMPIAVPVYMNAGFWEMLLKGLAQFSGALSVLPGPAGMFAGGISSIANATRDMFY